MTRVVVFISAFGCFLGPVWAGGPGEALAAALADCQKLPADQRPHVRYLTTCAIPEKDRAAFLKVLAFQCNILSREAELVVPAKITADLVRLDIRDYGWSSEVWEKLASVDPYFHVKIKGVELVTVTKVVDHPGGDFTYPDGRVARGVAAGRYRIEVQEAKGAGATTIAAAPWLDKKAIAELITATQSQAPFLRADWWFVTTARQVDRNNKATGAGYYDFLGIKTEKDIAEVVGLDRAKAQKVQREQAAIVADSGVALHNRQIYRYNAIAGAYWETLDVNSNEGEKNALRRLNGDYKPDAKEVFATLPNRLFLYAAVSVADGTLQNTVPDFIASDAQTASNDRRIHPSLSCVRCHVEGLRPIDDWARAFYADPPGDAKLTSPDYNKLKRLRRLYLSDLDVDYQADQLVYSRTLLKLTGWKPPELAKAYAETWHRYAEAAVGAEQFALELGTDQKMMLAAFEKYAKATGSLDPVLIGYLKNPAFLARREHAEEAYVLAQAAMGGYKP